jgi:two-component system KDP operon response regulator KdpE
MSATAKILIVDDEPHIRRLISGTLTRAGYDVIEASAARPALDLVERERPDVVLLDLGLPDRDGIELVPLIRQHSDAAVIVVSARDATDEKVAALDLGAIDYVTKPFDTDELLARIRAALRSRLVAEGGRSEIKVGDIMIDLVRHRITRADEEVHLTPKEFGVVAELARFPGRVITHEKLLAAVWPNDYERHVEYLRVVVRNIRQKLEDDPVRPTLIVNELGVGYRLMGG